MASNLAKAGPVLAIIGAIVAVSFLQLADTGVKVVGAIPQGLPAMIHPTLSLKLALE
jgi:SulP family sulfate permease